MWEGGNCSVLVLGPSELNILGGDRPDCTCVNMNMVVTQRDTLEDQTAGRRWPGSRGSLSGKVGAGMSAGLVGGQEVLWVLWELRALLVSESLEFGIYFPTQLGSQDCEMGLCPRATAGTGLSGTPEGMALCPTPGLDLFQKNIQREKGLSWLQGGFALLSATA